MLQIMLACTRTGQFVPTGIETDVQICCAAGGWFLAFEPAAKTDAGGRLWGDQQTELTLRS
jgi:hypothetical protein